MGDFFDAIQGELDALDDTSAGKAIALRAAGSLLHGATFRGEAFGTTFGADYDTNPDVVKQAQSILNRLSYQPALTVDGLYGPMTGTAIKWFQAAKGLPPDGVLGDATLKLLGIKPPTGAGSSSNWIQSIAMPAIPGLAQSVVNAFSSFSTKYEGYTPYMYTDSKGLVTMGIGNLIDPIGEALSLPWKHANGARATQQELIDAWNTVKNAYPGVQSTASQRLTDLRLDQEGIAELVHQKLAQNQQYLLSKYPAMGRWPADAQLALHSISWAWGPGFASVWGPPGSNFVASVNQVKPDFLTAASVMNQASQHEESINPGIVPRDHANLLMFENAAKVLASKGNLMALNFPMDYVARHPLRTAGIITTAVASAAGAAWALLRKG